MDAGNPWRACAGLFLFGDALGWGGFSAGDGLIGVRGVVPDGHANHADDDAEPDDWCQW